MLQYALNKMFVTNLCKSFALNSTIFNNARYLKRCNFTLLRCYSFRKRNLFVLFPDNRQELLKYNSNFLPVSSLITAFRYHDKSDKPSIIQRENIWTIPNILCLCRIALTPYLGHLILNSNFSQAFYIMLIAAITDFLDGLIARTWQCQSSKLGSFLDPMADKILIITLFSTMTYSQLIPAVLTILIIARDVSLAAAAFYIRYLSLPPPKTLARYFDVSHATAQLAPTFISKLNTVVQLVTVAATLTASAFEFSEHFLLPCLWFLTAGTTIASACSYIFSKNTYKILKKPNQNK